MPYIPESKLAFYTGNNSSKIFAEPVRAKVAKTLDRHFSLSLLPCIPLKPPLKSNSRKNMIRAVVFRGNGNDYRTVRISARSVMVAHSVHSQLPFFGRCIDNISPRTHAES